MHVKQCHEMRHHKIIFKNLTFSKLYHRMDQLQIRGYLNCLQMQIELDPLIFQSFPKLIAGPQSKTFLH